MSELQGGAHFAWFLYSNEGGDRETQSDGLCKKRNVEVRWRLEQTADFTHTFVKLELECNQRKKHCDAPLLASSV